MILDWNSIFSLVLILVPYVLWLKYCSFCNTFFCTQKFPWSKITILKLLFVVPRFEDFYTWRTFLNLDMNLRIPEMHSFYWILRRFWSYGSMQFCQQECYRILNYLLWKTAVNHMAIGSTDSKTYKVCLFSYKMYKNIFRAHIWTSVLVCFVLIFKLFTRNLAVKTFEKREVWERFQTTNK